MYLTITIGFLLTPCMVAFLENDCPRQRGSAFCTCHPEDDRRIKISCIVAKLEQLSFLPYCNHTSYSTHFTIWAHFTSYFPSSAISCKSITSLTVIGNRLASFDRGAFRDPQQKLKSLHLRKSNIQEIPIAAITGLTRLRTLNLEKNRIAALNVSLRGLTLKKLVLSENRISTMIRNKLPSSLEILNLNNNFIRTLNYSLTGYLSKLRMLFLSHNRIGTLKWELNNLPRLKLLDASHNLIYSIDGGTLSKLNKLEALELSHNEIFEIVDGLKGLPRLLMVNVSNNHLVYIHEEALTDLASLDTLNLRNNRINYLKVGSLDCLDSLALLDIENNDLRSLDFLDPVYQIDDLSSSSAGHRSSSQTVSNCVFRNYSMLEILKLSGNNLVCDKNIRRTIRIVRSKGVSVHGNPCKKMG